MPFKSRKQQAFFNANKAALEKKGVDVDEWNKASKGKKLPKESPKLKEAKRFHKVVKQLKGGA
jgi:hypothetical protein